MNDGDLTKREHFAGLAMQGIISNVVHLSELTKEARADGKYPHDYVAIAGIAYADALLAALNQTG